MNVHHLWKLHSLYDKKEMIEKTVLDDHDGDESNKSDN